MGNHEKEMAATAVEVDDGMVHLTLSDGSAHAFPLHYYPRLRKAQPQQLKEVELRVGGRALRWESLDEDIWIADAVCQNYPRETHAVAEPPATFRKE